MSHTRKQLEKWLKTIDVKGEVIDIGGLVWPVEGRTKSWNVSKYIIVDIKKTHRGREADYVEDLNIETNLFWIADTAFCLEVLQFVWNPVDVLLNINSMLRRDGVLYLTSHFLFPNHKGTDYLRYSRDGITKLLEETGFKIEEIVPMESANPKALWKFLEGEAKVQKFPYEIGHLIKARRI